MLPLAAIRDHISGATPIHRQYLINEFRKR
jgi:hypothetical protein